MPFNEELLKKTTASERQVFALIAQGLRTAEIAQELCLSRDTIESHRHSVIKKTGLKTSPQIIAEFVRGGMIYWCQVRQVWQVWAYAEEMPQKDVA